jgi:hypothetical protein
LGSLPSAIYGGTRQRFFLKNSLANAVNSGTRERFF